MTDIETIKEALDILLEKAVIGSDLEQKAAGALAALDRIEGRCLPELPENVFIERLWQPSEKKWRCIVGMHVRKVGGWEQIKLPETHYGLETPRAAVIAAIEKIGRDE